MQQFITPELKDSMMNNNTITDEMLYDIAKTLKPNHKSKARKTCINIIYKYLFADNITENVIDDIYKILGNKLLRYDDDDYCDNTINKIDNYIPDSNDNIYPLILIINALIGTELL